jgi:acyl-CoA synthetase (AMP-forming)/AMP-acid ligase II
VNIAHLFEPHVRGRPSQSAIVEGNRVITYQQLDEASARLAGLLASRGIEAGDRVLVLLGMSIDLYVALIALFRLGAPATFIDPSAGREHLARCCEIAAPKAVIGTRKTLLLRWIYPPLRRIKQTIRVSEARGAQPLRQIANLPAEAAALLTFTSGSTGQPKCAARDHRLLIAQHAALHRALDLQAGHTDLATLPIFALANLASGLTTIIADADLRRPGGIDPVPVLRQIERFRPHSCVASPSFFERLLAADRGEMKHLSTAWTGGAPVFPDLLNRLARATGQGAVALYGSTEAEPITHVSAHELMHEAESMYAGKGLLAGVPVNDVKLAILPNTLGQPIAPLSRAQFDAMQLPPGQAGEIVVTGDHVLRGYLGGAGDAGTKFRVDDTIWHRTGDAGYLDPAGRLWLLGRASAAIRDDHGEIYPLTVECAVRRLPGVHRSALLSHKGKRVLLIEGSADPDNVRASLAWAHLARVIRVAKIPVDKRHNAKIDYPAARALLESLG